MDPVIIQTFGSLGRAAGGAVPHGMAVQRSGVGIVMPIGKGGIVVDECQLAAWAAEANVICSLETDGLDAQKYARAAVAIGHTTGLVASSSFAAKDLSGVLNLNMLVRSSVALDAGDYTVAISKTTAGGGTLRKCTLPAMNAGEWYFLSLAIAGTPTPDFVDILSVAINCEVDKDALDFDIAMIYGDAQFYGIDGFTIDDAIQQNDTAKQYNPVAVIEAGILRADLAAGETVVAQQPVYPVPGTGRVSPTLINMDGPTVRAKEDQSTAGGRVAVLL